MKFKSVKRKHRALKESRIYGSSTSFTQKDIANISSKIDYDIIDACDFCLQLLEDVNAHDLMAKIEEVMENDPRLKEFTGSRRNWNGSDGPHGMEEVE